MILGVKFVKLRVIHSNLVYEVVKNGIIGQTDNCITNFSSYISKIISADISLKRKNIEVDKNVTCNLDKIALFKKYHTQNKPKSFHLHK